MFRQVITSKCQNIKINKLNPSCSKITIKIRLRYIYPLNIQRLWLQLLNYYCNIISFTFITLYKLKVLNYFCYKLLTYKETKNRKKRKLLQHILHLISKFLHNKKVPFFKTHENQITRY